MKIDLGTGLIDAYNFKLTSSHIIIDSNPKGDTDPYIQVKAKNDLSSKDTLYSILSVTKQGAQIAGWSIDNNSIRTGTLGTAGSYWMCRDGTSDKNPTPADFVGGAKSGWCLTIGRNFGVNKAGEMFGRGVTIKDGDITIYKPITNE
jgi:hypothetical protein